MRSFSVFALLVASASFASANVISINCTTNLNVITNVAISSPMSVACGGFSAPSGSQIVAVDYDFIGSFNDTNRFNGAKQLVFSLTTPYGTASNLMTNAGLLIGSTVNLGLTPATGLTLPSIAGYNVSVTTALAPGSATPDNASITIFANYTYETIPNGGVPEPSTLALVGGVLVLAGIRKFRS